MLHHFSLKQFGAVFINHKLEYSMSLTIGIVLIICIRQRQSDSSDEKQLTREGIYRPNNIPNANFVFSEAPPLGVTCIAATDRQLCEKYLTVCCMFHSWSDIKSIKLQACAADCFKNIHPFIFRNKMPEA